MKIDKTKNKTTSKRYDAGFTAGGLLYNEFIALEELLRSEQFEELIKIEEEQNNLIGIATNSARKRVISEIKKRNKIVPKDFWDHFFNWNTNEQKLALLYICLKAYPLIMEIHIEVALKRYRVGAKLDAYDVQMRFEEIISSDEEVAKWSMTTLNKINVQYRKVLKDAGLYTQKKDLKKPTNISNPFWAYFTDINEGWFLEACFTDKI